jgi:hypothetical protein
MKIAVVSEINGIETDANLVAASALEERDRYMKVAINLGIERKESREALGVRHSSVILQYVDVRWLLVLESSSIAT